MIARMSRTVLCVVGVIYLSGMLGGCGVFRGRGEDPTSWTNAEIGADGSAWSTARAALEEEARESPNEPYWPHRVAELELSSGTVEDAELWFRQALEVDPGYAPSLTRLSRLLYDQGRHFDAIDLLAPAVADHVVRGAPEVRACLALHQVATGDVAGAEATLGPLEARGEHWATVGSVLTYSRLQGERFREAPRWAERALEAEESAANCNNYGIALLQEGKPGEAREYFRRALELEPEQPGALYNLAIAEQFYFFDEAAAAEYFRRYRAVSDEDPDGLADIFGTGPEEELRVSGGDQ